MLIDRHITHVKRKPVVRVSLQDSAMIYSFGSHNVTPPYGVKVEKIYKSTRTSRMHPLQTSFSLKALDMGGVMWVEQYIRDNDFHRVDN